MPVGTAPVVAWRVGRRRYAADWARAVRRLGFVPLSVAETERLLLAHTVRLAQAVRAEPFGAGTAAEEVGPGPGRGAPHRAEALVELVAARARATVPAPGAADGRRRPADLGAPDRGGAGRAGRRVRPRAARADPSAEQERIARPRWQARDEVEQALRDSEARFRAVFNGAAIGIGIADVDGRIIDVNQALRRHARLLGRGAARDQRGRRCSTPTTRPGCGSSTRS